MWLSWTDITAKIKKIIVLLITMAINAYCQLLIENNWIETEIWMKYMIL